MESIDFSFVLGGDDPGDRHSAATLPAAVTRRHALPTRGLPLGLPLGLAGLLALACGAPEGGGPAEPPASVERPTAAPPVVLISIDTLRADRLPIYGYEGVETPHLDALAADGIVYENAISHIPLTLPSHASLFTGLLPPEHGVRDNIGYKLDERAIAAGTLPYLPALLRQRGYATGGAVSTFVLRGRMGLEEGFDFYEDSIEFRPGVGLGGMQRPGVETLGLAVEWLRGVADRPFFLFFHMYEPHTPYQPPEPFRSRYPDQPYDGEVATADQVVGDLLAELRRLGVYDKALVVVLSDHGEGLGDHGEDEHGILLNREAIHVPLIVKLPVDGRGAPQHAGQRVAAPVQLIDVLPTVADLLGLPLNAELGGRSLLDFLGDRASDPELADRVLYSETFYPRLHFGWSELVSLTDAGHQYIEGPEPELFDLVADPAQTRNVLREERRVYARLRDRLAAIDRELVAPSEVDEESRAALAALGYMGGSVATTDGPLPDPKSRLHTLDDLKAGFRYHSLKQDSEAVEAFRRALAENPGMLDAWEFLARSLQRAGRREEALEAYQKALELSGGTPHLAVSAASLFFELDRFDEAESHARLALEQHGSFAHGLLARIALARHDLDTAESEARLALDDENQRLGPQITLANVLYARGRHEEALERVAEIEATFTSRESLDTELIQGLYLLAGRIHADLGQAGPAETAFRREIELFPDQLAAYTGLALLYALADRPAAVPDILRTMVEANPGDRSYAEAVKTLRVLGFDPGARALLGHALGLYPESPRLRELTQVGGR